MHYTQLYVWKQFGNPWDVCNRKTGDTACMKLCKSQSKIDPNSLGPCRCRYIDLWIRQETLLEICKEATCTSPWKSLHCRNPLVLDELRILPISQLQWFLNHLHTSSHRKVLPILQTPSVKWLKELMLSTHILELDRCPSELQFSWLEYYVIFNWTAYHSQKYFRKKKH